MMDGQRHVIKRQVIEVKVRKPDEARLYQDELSRIYHQRILPLIEQRCNELSRPDRLYRIETLDLDLGRLDPNNLEDDFTQKVDAALRRELARQIDVCEEAAEHSGSKAQTGSQLELFAFFARTGSLPWWADASQPGLLAENLEWLLREASEALRCLLTELAHEAEIRRRLTNSYADHQLAALCGVLAPNYAEVFQRDLSELLATLQSVQADHGDLSMRFRQSLWNNLLLTTSLGGQQYTTLEDLYQAALKRTAADLGRTSRELFIALDRVIKDGRITVNRDLAGVITRIVNADARGSISVEDHSLQDVSVDKAEKPEFIVERLARRLTRLQAMSGPLSEAWRGLIEIRPKLPNWLQAELLALLERLPNGASEQAIALQILHLLERKDAAESNTAIDSPPSQESELPADTHEVSVPKSDAPGQVIVTHAGVGAEISKVVEIFHCAAGDSNLPRQTIVEDSVVAEKKMLDLRFSETEELLVGNAGLVILWPFLGHFFTRLGLLDDKQHFKDCASRHRSAGLLQVAATGDASPVEYLLPLNKLLCGLELSDVFDFGSPLLDAEAEECTALLKAVIAQASILHDMSVDGFRGTFLLRPGLLKAGDGMWLLHVERQTYDIVLERFPWNWEWVRLSWMEVPLRVEW